jgi:outer membrane receptor protein involved in Fe transport
VTSSSGQQVFSGSTAQAAAPVQTFTTTPAPAVRPSRSSTSSRTAPASSAPAQQAALSDLFSNYEPGRTPSLTGTSSGAPAGGAGSGLGLGIGLLAFGLFSLVAGLGAAEVRRRRAA